MDEIQTFYDNKKMLLKYKVNQNSAKMNASSKFNILTASRKKKIQIGLGTKTSRLIQIIVALPSSGKSCRLRARFNIIELTPFSVTSNIFDPVIWNLLLIVNNNNFKKT